jgi:hypothetical protein
MKRLRNCGRSATFLHPTMKVRMRLFGGRFEVRSRPCGSIIHAVCRSTIRLDVAHFCLGLELTYTPERAASFFPGRPVEEFDVVIASRWQQACSIGAPVLAWGSEYWDR